MKYTSQRGTRDILPQDIPLWHAAEQTCKRVFGLYNYEEIRTPIFESTELFLRSIGEDTDIVSKEMYTFQDKGERSITLRPEATAPVVRAVIQNNLLPQDKALKLYYIGPMFRYERPQAGRYRQFYQAGVEVFGSKSPFIDVEVISLAVHIMSNLGINDVEVAVNSVGCQKCRPGYVEKLKEHLSSNLKNLCETCNDRFNRNPLRILDCKDEKCRKTIDASPVIDDFLCEECKEHFNGVQKGLDLLKIKYRTDKKLVRGLDYYTKTAFELVSNVLGAQNSVCGGGRYDNLVKELGGGDVPAIGFAFGVDRIVEILSKIKNLGNFRKKLVYVAAIGEEAKKLGFELSYKIRKSGHVAEMDYFDKSLKSQMKEADRLKASYVLIIGDDEIKSGKVVFRDMEKKDQVEISLDNIFERIERL